jgi:Domain of unknown function (DUF222)
MSDNASAVVDGDDAAAAALGKIRAGVDRLLGLSPDELSDDQLRTVLRAVEQQSRRLPVVTGRIVRVLDERAVARRQGLRDTAGLLRKDLRLAPGEARARMEAAARPEAAVVAAAQEAGELSAAHVRVIADVVDALPEPLRDQHRGDLEAALVDAARTLDPVRLAARGRQLVCELDPTGLGRDEREQERRRGASLVLNPDGSAGCAPSSRRAVRRSSRPPSCRWQRPGRTISVAGTSAPRGRGCTTGWSRVAVGCSAPRRCPGRPARPRRWS